MNWKDLTSGSLTAVLAVTCSCTAVAADGLTARQLVAAMKASIGQISTIEAHYRTYFKALSGQGVVRGPDGQGMYSEFQWGYDPKADAEYLDGIWASHKKDGTIYYNDTHITFDGKILHGENKRSRSGKILGERADLFAPWMTPSTLWGRNFVPGPSRSVVETLDGATLADLNDTPSHLKVVRNAIKVGLEDWDVTVWIDCEHGFLPRRMEAAKTLFRIVMLRIDVDEICEVRPGLWIPVRGRLTGFTVVEPERPNGVYSNGMTFEQISRLPREELFKLVPTLGFKQKPLGYGTETLVVDKDTIRINEGIPPDRLTIEFPKGTMVWDGVRQIGYQVGRWDDPAEQAKEQPTSTMSRRIGLWLSGLLLVAVTAFGLWRCFHRHPQAVRIPGSAEKR